MFDHGKQVKKHTKLARRWTLGQLHLQSFGDQFAKRLAARLVQALLVRPGIDRGLIVRQRQHHHLHLRVVVVRHSSGRHLDRGNAERLEAVSVVPLRLLRRHPARRADKRVVHLLPRHVSIGGEPRAHPLYLRSRRRRAV
ncbi:uncharacterized protein LOC120908211 [Anopheles arabiensis]|uniref:uncharacterized protein LOC120897803 n=1 Tax=Anopheles arabiensis TaxID=7173 RepID=UPI001AAC66CE|nr:uncharacterized protein LOC120897803 [Anopheles arabiensis]XP_040175094.1 uncharacterized protein LOC120908211 [Anopheles arabiensis]